MKKFNNVMLKNVLVLIEKFANQTLKFKNDQIEADISTSIKFFWMMMVKSFCFCSFLAEFIFAKGNNF